MPISLETPNPNGLQVWNHSLCNDPHTGTHLSPPPSPLGQQPPRRSLLPLSASPHSFQGPLRAPPLLPNFPWLPVPTPYLTDKALSHMTTHPPGLISLPDHPEIGLLTIPGTCPALCDTTHPSWVTPCLSSRTQHRAAPSMKPQGSTLPPWHPQGAWARLCIPSPQCQAQGRRLQDTSGQRRLQAAQQPLNTRGLFGHHQSSPETSPNP